VKAEKENFNGMTK